MMQVRRIGMMVTCIVTLLWDHGMMLQILAELMYGGLELMEFLLHVLIHGPNHFIHLYLSAFVVVYKVALLSRTHFQQ